MRQTPTISGLKDRRERQIFARYFEAARKGVPPSCLSRAAYFDLEIAEKGYLYGKAALEAQQMIYRRIPRRAAA